MENRIISELKNEANGNLEEFQHLLSTHVRTAAWFAAAVLAFGLLYPALKAEAPRLVAKKISQQVNDTIVPPFLKILDEVIESSDTILIEEIPFKIIKNKGNGDCQYMAFANACGYQDTPEMVQYFRSIVANTLPSLNSESLVPHLQDHVESYKEYKNILRGDGSINLALWQKRIRNSMWGDALTLQILSNYFRFDIKYYISDTKSWGDMKSVESSDGTIYLLYVSDTHYDALLLIPEI